LEIDLLAQVERAVRKLGGEFAVCGVWF
jgi:hypothetical protein